MVEWDIEPLCCAEEEPVTTGVRGGRPEPKLLTECCCILCDISMPAAVEGVDNGGEPIDCILGERLWYGCWYVGVERVNVAPPRR
jgi:hypothetical protein